jgi:hypothetical protein
MRANGRLPVLAGLFVLSAAVPGQDERLTPVGAESAGNADGSIPAWNGGLLPMTWPAEYKAGGRLADPYAGDKPAFTITAANYRQYASRLAPGQLALFAKYADYTMPVYPTRRSVSFPQEVYDATEANRKSAKLAGADAIAGARLGIPFPEPKSGVELMWNHRLRYHADSAAWDYHRALVNPGGGTEVSQARERVWYRYANVKDPADLARENMYAYTDLWLTPCEDAYPNLGVLWHDPINAFSSSRRIWGYALGYVRRHPPLGYDQVGLCSHRVRYFDMVDMFNGGFDRYVFKLVGKRELYVPYNAYRLSSPPLKNKALLAAGHFNQGSARYELHRVWVVDAPTRPGAGHIVARRTFYLDEDSWSVLLVDCYDGDGRLWRFQEGHLLALYPVQGVDYAPLLTYDLKDGRYFADRLLAEDSPPVFNATMTAGQFSPDEAKKGHP